MITGTLSNGFNFKIDEKKVFTHKFRRLMTKSIGTIRQGNDEELTPEEKERIKKENERILKANEDLIEYLLGEDGVEALEDFILEQTGEEVSAKEFDALIVEIINTAKREDEDTKKSSPSPE